MTNIDYSEPLRAEDVDGFLDGLAISEQRGDLVAVDWLLQSQICRRIERFASIELHRQLADVRERLAKARSYEATHGEGSVLVPDHPLNVKLKEVLKRSVRAMSQEPGTADVPGDQKPILGV